MPNKNGHRRNRGYQGPKNAAATWRNDPAIGTRFPEVGDVVKVKFSEVSDKGNPMARYGKIPVFMHHRHEPPRVGETLEVVVHGFPPNYHFMVVRRLK